MAKVIRVDKHGAACGKIKAGDDIVAFNGRDFEDILDYIYADSEQDVKIEFIDKKGLKKSVSVNNYDTLGLCFEDSVEIKPIQCRNNCIFCFVDQLPKGLRESLYIKDDDYRLSFISGTYITCTNLSEKDIQRIIDYKLSPLYISVHATDDKIRKLMLGIKKSPPLEPIIKRFVCAGITIHAQIVAVAGINDKETLEKSLLDLYEMGVKSVAVVPVGLTLHREGLCGIKPLTANDALGIIETVEKFYQSHKYFCFVSDEMYQIAGMETKDYDYYGDFEQIENGVGLTAKFLYEINESLEFAPKRLNKSIGIITGKSGEKCLLKIKEILESRIERLEINIYAVENNFFGKTVTVAGLITATDIIKHFDQKNIGEDMLIIPAAMLKEFEDVFLDGVSVRTLKKKLNKKITVSPVTGEGFLDAIINGDK
ncbi:MAG: DUF512 domain-containing protein [Christensenellales bacterium]|jgi:putative radical SAM enzyme (TIGR03279 family)